LERAAPFTGALLIIGGFLCCFLGSILIAWAVALLLAVAASVGTFLIAYNFIPYDVPSAVITLLLLGSIGAGLVAGHFGYKWSKSHSIYVPIIGGWAGLVAASLLLNLFSSEVFGLNQYAQVAGVLVGALLGGIVANHFKAKLKWIGTAAVGSYILTTGVRLAITDNGHQHTKTVYTKTVAGATPEAGHALGYLAGGIILAVLGALFQWKYFASKVEEDDDDYKKDDHDEGTY